MVVEDSSVSSAIMAEENLDPNKKTNPSRKVNDLPAIRANFGEEGPSKEKKIFCDDNVSKKSTTLVQFSHSLQNCWTFWFDSPQSKSNQATWGSSLRSLYTFATIEEFWSLYNNMHPPTKWIPGADLYCFKDKIEPKWEDPICANGGKWIMMFPKAKLDSNWLNTLLALVGEQFEQGDEICGAVLNFRARGDKISLWTKNAANEEAQLSIGKQWKELVGYNETIGFIFHEDAKTLDRGAKCRYSRREKEENKKRNKARRLLALKKEVLSKRLKKLIRGQSRAPWKKRREIKDALKQSRERWGRNSGSGPSESGRRSDRRHETESRSWAENRENEDSGDRIEETGRIRDHQENLQQQIQSPRDIEMQRRSHETESRSLQQKKAGQATTPDWGGSGSKRKFDEGTRMRHEAAQSSVYPVRPGEKDCPHYLNFGLCSYGRSCHFNHPTHLRPTCKYFVRGACKYGSACRFYHPMDRDGAEPALFNVPDLPTHQDERRHETESSSWPEKRARTIPDSRERDPRGSFEDISQRRDEKVAGFNRARLEQGHGNIEWQRREGQENVQEQRQQIENVEWHKEFMEKQRLRNLEEERLREIDRQRREARMRLDQMQQTVNWN